jgi:hypothetical protein
MRIWMYCILYAGFVISVVLVILFSAKKIYHKLTYND